MMKASLEKVSKIIKHEADLGYEDRAVMGGLEKMIPSWEADARADGLPEEVVEAVSSRLREYKRLSANARKDVLIGLSRRIQRMSEEPQEQPPASEERPRPAPSRPPREEEKPNRWSEKREEKPSRHAETAAAARSLPKESPAALDAPVSVLTGVGPVYTKILARLGIHTLADMLYYFPRRYDDYSALKPINRLWYGEDVTVIGVVQSVNNRAAKTGRKLTEIIVSDGSGSLRVTWFNQPWKLNQLQPGVEVVLSGRVEQFLGRITMNNPECDILEQKHLNTHRIVPVYPLSAEIKQRKLRVLMDKVVSYWAQRVADPLPLSILESAGLMDLPQALLQIHFPETAEALSAARSRLAFEEIFYLQLGVLEQKRAWDDRAATVFSIEDEWLDAQVTRLPFELTGAQRRAFEDIRRDLASGRPMNRLLQGDVGSGKTVLAALAAAAVAGTGAQSAIMAPTGILAEQHYRSLTRLFAESEVIHANEIRLVVGGTPEREKEEIRAELAEGKVKLIIGTHALLEDVVQFADLQLVVVDEQHRFGVEQRAILRGKGQNPHLLVMTATPIPRSLALTVYGDLDLSVMDELPPGRQEIETFILSPAERNRAYTLIENQVEKGRQVFIIYPLVEESETLEVKAAVEEYDRLQKEVFPRLNVGLLHGRMRADEKDAVMARFRDGETHILVSTAVVEVGVDVPNATVMIIEGANRFGLAQLHQFRGRVGRGSEKSTCVLIPANEDAAENERLLAMTETNDGFKLAERDLEQRGPGDFLGTRQSGFAELRLASLTDVRLIEKARNQAQTLFERDPVLEAPENALLVEAMKRFWNPHVNGDIS